MSHIFNNILGFSTNSNETGNPRLCEESVGKQPKEHYPAPHFKVKEHYHLRHWEIRITLALGVWLVSESEVNESTSRFDEERRLNAPANGV